MTDNRWGLPDLGLGVGLRPTSVLRLLRFEYSVVRLELRRAEHDLLRALVDRVPLGEVLAALVTQPGEICGRSVLFPGAPPPLPKSHDESEADQTMAMHNPGRRLSASLLQVRRCHTVIGRLEGAHHGRRL